MSWLVKKTKKYARKAVSRASSSAWKTVKSTLKKKKAPKLKPADQDELNAWRWWGRSLGSLSLVLRGKKSASSASPRTSSNPKPRPSSSNTPKKAGKKAPLRKRAKGERLPPDPRFTRTQAKYEAKRR